MEYYEELAKLVTVFLAETVIPEFKAEKMSLYYKVLQAFSVQEINNSHLSATYWSNVLGNTNPKHF